jgi:serine/threonine-protein kinase HipA
MKFQKNSLIHVSYVKGLNILPMGRLALKDRKIFFEYHADFLKTGLKLSPFKLPLRAGIFTSEDPLFEGLFGVFNDSLPDGWGRLLLDRKLMKLGINPSELSPLDRLRYVGSHGMGALTYEPEIEAKSFSNHLELDEIAEEVFLFQEKDEDQFVDDLLEMNGSSAGARPKIMIHFEGEDWIIKFPSLFDTKDIGAIEYAYHLMAKEANLDVPKAKLFPSRKGPGYFGVKRFDRDQENRFHIHSISGLLHTDHRIPSLDYETILKATLWLTKDVRECEKQFRLAVFNVLTHNRDDHAKNFSFLMNENGLWTVSKAYDLTFSSGPAGEHCTTVMGEGKNPKLTHLLALASLGGIKKQKALEIIDETKQALLKWNAISRNAGVSKSSSDLIGHAFERILKDM